MKSKFRYLLIQFAQVKEYGYNFNALKFGLCAIA